MGKDLDRTAENGNMVQKAAEQAVELDEDMLGGVSGGTSGDYIRNGERTASEGTYHTCGTKLRYLQMEGSYFCPVCKKSVVPSEILDYPGVRMGADLGDYIVKG